MIAGWLANKALGMLIFCIACLAPFLLVGMIVQTVRIDGLDLGGLYLVQGYKAEAASAEHDLDTLRSNQASLRHGLDVCNTSVDSIAKAAGMMTANAKALIDAAAPLRSAAAGAVKVINAIKSTRETCPTADSIFTEGFR